VANQKIGPTLAERRAVAPRNARRPRRIRRSANATEPAKLILDHNAVVNFIDGAGENVGSE
jgi:hypothetical protein